MKTNLQRLTLLVFLACLYNYCSAQSRQAPIILGVETGGSVSIVPKRSTDDFPRFWDIRTAPYIDIRTIKNLYLGLNYEVETGKINGQKIKPLKGYGAHARYFLPLFKNKPGARDRIQVYSELAFIALNHAIDSTQSYGIKYLSSYSNFNTQFVIGADFRLFNSLYINVGLRPMFYTQGKTYQWSSKLGLEYHLGEKRAKYTKPDRPTNPDKTPRAQALDFSYFLDKVTVGSSLTYIRNAPDEKDPGYTEKTWNINAAVSITSDLDVGLAVLPMWVNYDGQPVERRLLSGIFTQYDVLRQYRSTRIFIETGYYRGNHFVPYGARRSYKPNLSYIPVGGGFEAKISRQIPLFFDFSVLFYQILNKVPEKKSAFGQYVLGLNYHFYP